LGRRNTRATKRSDSTEQQDPLKQRFFFQELPPDIQMVVLQGVRFRVSMDPLPEDLGLFDLDDLLDEEADDIININRNNSKKTVAQWLEFAETAGSGWEAHHGEKDAKDTKGREGA
jgi:hypothetical protein